MSALLCTECNGKGYVPDYGPLGHDFEGAKQCPECKGIGFTKRSNPKQEMPK